MTLLEASEKVKGLRLDTTKEFILYPDKGTQEIRVYKTKPAKYIVSVDAWNSIDTKCQVAELTHRRRRFVRSV